MNEITAIAWILSAVVILMASVLKGVTGFGFALFAVPILSLLLPIHMLIPAMILFNFLASLYLLIQIKVKLQAKYFIPMFLASLAGIPIGVYALQDLNEMLLRLVVGLVIVVFSLLLFFRRNHEPRHKNKPIVFAGFLSGLLGSSISLSGPPIAFAMSNKGYRKNRFRANFAIFGMLSSLFTAITYLLKGIIQIASVKFTVYLFPLLLIGSRLGNHWAGRIKNEKFKKIVIGINFITGLTVVIVTILKFS